MNEMWNDTAQQLHQAKQARKYYEELEKSLLDKLKILSDNKPARGEIFQLKSIMSPGRVQYDKIPELYGVCLDKYRGEPLMRWTLTELVSLPESIKDLNQVKL